jgi:threonine synthase
LIEEAVALGATVSLVEGTIADAALLQARKAEENGWFSLATFAEPYRVEGKKMMGYETFWDMGRVPDVIIYPTGGGTGLVGMAKAFDEMKALGWVSRSPRFVAAQVSSCAPIVEAFHQGRDHAVPWPSPGETAAYGLRVPSAIGDRLMLEALRSTHGNAVAVTEEQMMSSTRRLAAATGIWGSPEGGATLAAYELLLAQWWLGEDDSVVLFNTGAASKYA